MRGACPLSTLPVMGYLSFRNSTSETVYCYRPTKPLLFFDKESPAGGLRRSIRQTDTICLCRAVRPVRHDPVASPQDGTPTKQVSDKTRPQNRCGNLWARIRRQDNETPALNALKALRGTPISMGRGEIPVELRPAAIRFLPLL